ncbi:hypothetical protein LEP1GSC126_4299 [Leptospira kirschneri str. 200801774]|nr:hypothetical protein LEP1GSC126_4299 [Leptospira kirschneri str. 200801774]
MPLSKDRHPGSDVLSSGSGALNFLASIVFESDYVEQIHIILKFRL